MTEFKTAAEAYYSDPTKLPCGCNEAQAKFSGRCMCNPKELNDRGEFERSCKACEITFVGTRITAVGEWWAHVKTAEHEATYSRRQFELREEAEAERLQLAGMLF